MGPAYKSLVLVTACVVTILVVLMFSRPAGEAPVTASVPAPALTAAGEPEDAGRFFFDVIGHSAEEFHALMQRARTIYEQTPEDARPSLEIVLVLHGPDIDFFVTRNYAKFQHIVDLAAQLDAFGVFDFKMCAASAASLGIAQEDVPAFVEFVPYGPTEIQRLEDAGFVRL